MPHRSRLLMALLAAAVLLPGCMSWGSSSAPAPVPHREPGWTLLPSSPPPASLPQGAGGLHLSNGTQGDESGQVVGGQPPQQPQQTQQPGGGAPTGTPTSPPTASPPAQPSPAASEPGYGLTVVQAFDRGCSPDSATRPDLRVTVWVDGAQVAQTVKAQDRDDPLYGLFVPLAHPSAPVTVRVRVEEAEPTYFFFGTTWVHCDTAPGNEEEGATTWDGSLQAFDARGDGGNAAEADLVLGGAAPTAPTLTVAVQGTHALRVTFDGSAADQALHWGRVGPALAPLSPSAGAVTLSGLCDNQEYVLRVVRTALPWRVSSADAAATTANEAPAAPRVLSATMANGSVEVSWEEATPHDAATYDVYAADGSTVPLDAAHRIGSLHASTLLTHESGSFPWHGGGSVRVATTDSGGLSAASAAFEVGGPAEQWTPLFESCGAEAGTVA
jgi:hypothetical protein